MKQARAVALSLLMVLVCSLFGAAQQSVTASANAAVPPLIPFSSVEPCRRIRKRWSQGRCQCLTQLRSGPMQVQSRQPGPHCNRRLRNPGRGCRPITA
jgi:hypothetical protein